MTGAVEVGRTLVVGDLVTDIVAVHSGPIATGSDTPSRISVGGGGSAANTAAWLAWHGCPAGLVAVIGADRAGDERLAELAAAGVDCTGVRRSPHAATGSVIVLAHGTERSFLNDRGANLLLTPSDVDKAMVGPVRHVHVSGYTLLDDSSRAAGRHAFAAARAAGVSSSVDAASAAPLRRVTGAVFRSWIHDVDVVFANLDEARALLDETSGDETPADDRTDPADRTDPIDLALRLAQTLTAAGEPAGADRTTRGVVVKLGSDGAIWADRSGATVRIPATPPDRVVDGTGAGDAFAAGFLSSWRAGGSPEQALHAGARAGALAVALPGGRPR